MKNGNPWVQYHATIILYIPFPGFCPLHNDFVYTLCLEVC